MLAERKQKMKWSPNPCGNLWANDSSKFGQKMLEKFGWTPGKGLGVNEQGIVNPVRLKCNSTQRGLGYERGNKATFFQHQEEFNSILSNLNSSDETNEANETCLSLEQKSKNCKTRVHYHKFTRGKDLSRYSEKDLSCILGVVSAFEKSIASRNDDSEKSEENNKMWELSKTDNGCDKSDQQNQASERNESKDDTTVKLKKKRKRKHENIDNDSKTVEFNSSIKIDEFETYQSQIKPFVEEQNIVLSENPSSKKKRKQKYENIDDNIITRNDDSLNKIDKFDMRKIQIESRFDERKTALSENSTNKEKRKHGIISSLEEDVTELSETKVEQRINQNSEISLDNHNNVDSSDIIPKKKKKKHKKNK